jgi:hypothetical protein
VEVLSKPQGVSLGGEASSEDLGGRRNNTNEKFED